MHIGIGRTFRFSVVVSYCRQLLFSLKMDSRLFAFILVLSIFSFTNGKNFCDYPNCICYNKEDPCPPGLSDCSDEEYCTLDTNKPCCYNTPRTFCDSPGCGCYYFEDPCPPSTTDCSATKYCTLPTNKPCCNTWKATMQSKLNLGKNLIMDFMEFNFINHLSPFNYMCFSIKW